MLPCTLASCRTERGQKNSLIRGIFTDLFRVRIPCANSANSTVISVIVKLAILGTVVLVEITPAPRGHKRIFCFCQPAIFICVYREVEGMVFRFGALVCE